MAGRSTENCTVKDTFKISDTIKPKFYKAPECTNKSICMKRDFNKDFEVKKDCKCCKYNLDKRAYEEILKGCCCG